MTTAAPTLTIEQAAYADHPLLSRVNARGQLCVPPAVALAVAGSGKTTSTCSLVKNAVLKGHRASDILVATFSKAGAIDMAARASRLAVPAGVSWRTIHSAGWSIVGEICCLGGLAPAGETRSSWIPEGQRDTTSRSSSGTTWRLRPSAPPRKSARTSKTWGARCLARSASLPRT